MDDKQITATGPESVAYIRAKLSPEDRERYDDDVIVYGRGAVKVLADGTYVRVSPLTVSINE